MRARALECEKCGAALPPPVHQVTTCTYCGVSHHVGAPVVYVPRPEVRAWSRDATLHERLYARADLSPVGAGVRYAPDAHPDPFALDRAMWAARASASSTYGGAWSPDALVGPPTVYPEHGDRAGAWAPLLRTTSAEWVEVGFAHQRPAAALRVYETNESGGVYAVVAIDERGETLVYRAPPQHFPGQARMLEICLEPPRVVQRARVYLTNDRGRSWTELDAIAAIAVEPLPTHMRSQMPSSIGCRPRAIAVALVLLIAAVIAAVKLADRGVGGGTLTTTSAQLGFSPPVATMHPATNDVVWASGVVGFSTEYETDRNGSRQVVGPPDVFPQHADLAGAWASRGQDDGTEWITVSFPPTQARALVWLETLAPGAITRIDDLSEPATPVTLWEGRVAPPGAIATTWTLAFPVPRTITVLRLVLDTTRVAGWNEIDAIGLLPAR